MVTGPFCGVDFPRELLMKQLVRLDQPPLSHRCAHFIQDVFAGCGLGDSKTFLFSMGTPPRQQELIEDARENNTGA